MKTLGLTLYKGCARKLSGLGLRRYAAVNRFNDWVRGLVKTRQANVLGHSMILDACDSLDLSLNGIYEPFETKIAQEIVQPGDTVVDVGANIGYYTLLLARAVGPAGRVFAFEPDPENYRVLQQNISINGYRNVTAIHAAVSDSAGTLRLFQSRENRGDHRVYAGDEKRPSVEVRAISLDDFLRGTSTVSFVKMDVQGAEGRVIAGMKSLLKKSPDIRILFEFWPSGMKQAGTVPRDTISHLLNQGLSLQLVDETAGQLNPISVDDLFNQFNEVNGRQTNLLAARDLWKLR